MGGREGREGEGGGGGELLLHGFATGTFTQISPKSH